MTSIRRRIAISAMAALLGITMLPVISGCSDDDSAAQTSAETDNVLVLGERDVATVTEGVLEEGILVTGTLQPYLRVSVKAQVSGTLQNVRLAEGQPVRQGAVMATIDAEGIRSQAASAQAAVAAAEANLALARRQLESAKTLYDAGAMSAIAYEQAQTAYESAEAQLAAAKSQAAGASEQAGRTTVNAPISGVVSARVAEAGEAVNPGQELFTIVNTSILELAGNVPVSSARFVEVGQPVVFTLDSYPGQAFRGTVARIDPTADPQSRQLGIYLRMENPGRVVGGLFATGRILATDTGSGPLVPIGALRGDANDQYVYVVRNQTIERQPVTVTARDQERGLASVDSLEIGTVVITSPGAAVQQGMRVRLPGEQELAEESTQDRPESTE